MRFPRVDLAAAAKADHASVSPYQLTLHGSYTSVLFQAAFNALAALSLILLGHPLAAAIAFTSYCSIDLVQKHLVSRWLAETGEVDEDHGFSRLALLSLARISIYIAPALAVALRGRAGELALLGIQGGGLLCIAMQSGTMSRRLFWALATPVLAAFAVVAVARLQPMPMAGVLISLASLTAILAALLEGTYRTIHMLHAAFNDNVADDPAARDRPRRSLGRTSRGGRRA